VHWPSQHSGTQLSVVIPEAEYDSPANQPESKAAKQTENTPPKTLSSSESAEQIENDKNINLKTRRASLVGSSFGLSFGTCEHKRSVINNKYCSLCRKLMLSGTNMFEHQFKEHANS